MVLLTLSSPAGAFERPPFKDGLVNDWHPGSICIPCHYTLLSTEDARAISYGCSCHRYVPKAPLSANTDMTKILDIHENIVCIKCHVGKQNVNNVTASDFHRIMNKVACMQCHTIANGTIQKPLKTNCSDCHAADPHVVHDKKLEDMCVLCHGDYINKFASTTGAAGSGTISALSAAFAKPNDAAAGYPSMGQFISGIFQFILQIMR